MTVDQKKVRFCALCLAKNKNKTESFSTLASYRGLYLGIMNMAVFRQLYC